MSKPKYKQGKQITSVAQFENSTSKWFKWNGLTRHRSVLESLQYHTLSMAIYHGRVFVADLIKGDDLGDYPDTIHNQFDNMTGSMNL